MGDEIKDAEKRGYQRGYVSGRKKTESELSKINSLVQELTNRHRSEYVSIFCAALGATLPLTNWTMEGKQITSLFDHVLLAIQISDQATENIRHKP